MVSEQKPPFQPFFSLKKAIFLQTNNIVALSTDIKKQFIQSAAAQNSQKK